jgi:hypothetical protein
LGHNGLKPFVCAFFFITLSGTKITPKLGMKGLKNNAIAIGIIVVCGTLLAGIFLTTDSTSSANLEEVSEKKTGISPYRQWVSDLKTDHTSGPLTFEQVFEGKNQVKEALAAQQQGMQRALGIEWEDMGPNNIGGRTRAVYVSRDNPARMYAGSVSGGLFVSDNGGLSWAAHAQNAIFSSTVIGAISESAGGDIYFGTGELFISYFDGSGSFTRGFAGDGIYKSSDGGETFTLLESTVPTPGTIGSTASVEWAYVTRIAAHPTDNNLLMAGTNSGLKITRDGGVTWNDASEGAISLGSGTCQDVTFDVNGLAHAMYNNRYIKSSDATTPENFASISTGLPTALTLSRSVIAVAPSDPNYVYIYAGNGGGLVGVYQSTDGGTSFSTITPSASDLFNPPGGQASYNLCIAVNPADATLIYIGGQIFSYKWRQSAASWTQMSASFGGPLFSKYVHADHHYFTFHPNNPDILYMGTDGGVFRTLNARADYPDWSDLNKGYGTLQLHGVGAGLEGELLGGSQDNGSQYVEFNGNSLLEALDVLGGDGAEGEVSKIKPPFLFASFYDFGAGTFGAGALRRSVNGGNSFANMFDFNIDADQDGTANNGADFVEADYLWEDMSRWFTFGDVLSGDTVEFGGSNYALGDDVTFEGETFTLDANSLYRGWFFYGTQNSIWMTPEALKNSTEGPPVWFRISGVSSIGNVTAVDVSEDGDMCVVGNSGGSIYRITGLQSAALEYIDYDGNPSTDPEFFADSAGIVIENIGSIGDWVTGVSIDDNDKDHIVVSRGGYGVASNVYRTTNGQAASVTFTAISSGLPNIPVYDCMVEYYNSDNILAATEFGIWSYDASNPGSGWIQETSILGNVPVFEIRQDIMREFDCRPIYLGSHGRGYFRAVNFIDEALACDFEIRGDATGNDDPIQEDIIAKISISPNPASSSARLNFQLNDASRIKISIYDLTGKRVKQIIANEQYTIGSHNVGMQIGDLSVGSYLVVVESDSQIKSTKLAVVR